MDGHHCSANSTIAKSVQPAHEAETFIDNNRQEVLDDGLGSKWRIWKRRRYLVIALTFLGQIARDLLRANLSVAILSMTENTTITTENGTIVYRLQSLIYPYYSANEDPIEAVGIILGICHRFTGMLLKRVQEFEWDVKTRGFLLSIFFYGYITTILAGGLLAVKYGGTKLYGLGIGITAFTTILTPAVARLNLYLLMALRFFEGVCEGVLLPSVEYVYANWIPMEERSSLVGFSTSGMFCGIVIGIAVSGAIAHHWGWSAIFYTTGAIGLAWYLLWALNVKEYPRFDKKISPSERTYIETTINKKITLYRTINSVPLLKILTSVPLWAVIIAHVPSACAYILFATLLPSYMKDVLKQDTQKSSYLSSLPFLVSVLLMNFLSPFADFLVNRKLLSTIAVRKIFICGCMLNMAIFCFTVQQVTSTPAITVCLVGMMIGAGTIYSQAVVNFLDLAPSYSSVMSGVFVTVNAFCGMQAPTIAAYLTPNKTAEEWNTVFSILGGMSLVTGTIYCAFGSAQLQPWAPEKDGENFRPNDAEE